MLDYLQLFIKMKIHIRGPNLFFKYFYFLFGPGYATVQIFYGTLVSAKKKFNRSGHPKGGEEARPKKEIKIFEK